MSRITNIGLLVTILMLAACQTAPPQDAFRLPAASLEIRQLQTRRFEDIDEVQLLAASAGVLQDLGFNLDESEVELGLIIPPNIRRSSFGTLRARRCCLPKRFMLATFGN